MLSGSFVTKAWHILRFRKEEIANRSFENVAQFKYSGNDSNRSKFASRGK
jgi:hypothetical protein